MFLKLTAIEENESGMTESQVIINTDNITRFTKETFTDSHDNEYVYVKVELVNGRVFPIKETLEEINTLVNDKYFFLK